MSERNKEDILLLGMMRAEYDRAKLFAYWGYFFEFIAALAAVLTIRFMPEKLQSFSPILVFVLVLIGFLLKSKFSTIRDYAEKARRTTVFMKGLDYQITEKKRQELEKPFSKRAKIRAEQNIEDNSKYFATQRPAGAIRLFDMLQESAFYQHSLMQKATHYTNYLIIGFIILSFIVLYTFAFIIIGEKQNWTNELFVTLLSLFITTGFINLHRNYFKLGNEIKNIDDQMEAIRNSKHTPGLTEVFALLDEYDCLLMECPVVPNRIYKWNKNELDNAWEKRQKEYDNQVWK